MSNLTFLIVEDEALIAMHTEQMLSGMGHEVSGVTNNGQEAMEMADALHPDVIVMDILLAGGMSGLEAAEEIQRRHGTPFIFISGSLEKDHMNRIEKLDHFGFLSKPIDMPSMDMAVRLAVAWRK